MSHVTPTMREFASRLSAYEARGDKSGAKNPPPTFSVCEKLRPHLATLVGKAGYRALLLRAMALAGAEVPWLRGVAVAPDGSFEGLEKLHAKLDPQEFIQGRSALLAQLLGLLVAFIGENLTLRLVREIWPGIPVGDLDFGNGGKNEKSR
jgi:hypothetical protein